MYKCTTGYYHKIIEAFLTASNIKFEGSLINYDKLIISLLPESLQQPKDSQHLRLLTICAYVASLTDGFALQLYKKLMGD